MRTMSTVLSSWAGLGILLTSGCLQSPEPTVQEKPKEGIIGRTTNEIGEFDPKGTAKEVDLKVDENSNPLKAATGAYKYAAATTSILKIKQALQLYNAEFDRYPQDHAEFMELIVKPNQIELPVLPGGARYQYDVENHELKIVEAE